MFSKNTFIAIILLILGMACIFIDQDVQALYLGPGLASFTSWVGYGLLIGAYMMYKKSQATPAPSVGAAKSSSAGHGFGALAAVGAAGLLAAPKPQDDVIEPKRRVTRHRTKKHDTKAVDAKVSTEETAVPVETLEQDIEEPTPESVSVVLPDERDEDHVPEPQVEEPEANVEEPLPVPVEERAPEEPLDPTALATYVKQQDGIGLAQ